MSKPCLLPLFLCGFYQNAFDLFKYYTSLQFLSFSNVSFFFFFLSEAFPTCQSNEIIKAVMK